MRHKSLHDSGKPVPTKLSKKASIAFALAIVSVLICLMVFVQMALDIENPIVSYYTGSSSKVVDIRFHHGLGTFTEVRTTNDVLLLADAVRLAIGQEVVLQQSQNSERLCVKDLQRCWRVVNN